MGLASSLSPHETFLFHLQAKPSTASRLFCSTAHAEKMVPLNKFYTAYKSRMDAKKPYMLKFRQMRLFFLQSGGNCGGKAFERWQRDICRFLRFCRRSSLD